jgi:hypothetical protein
MLQSVADSPANAMTFHVDVEQGRALAMPSFEALAVSRRLLQATGGFVDAPPHGLVVSLDIDRVRLVHAELIEQITNMTRGTLNAARGVGAASAMQMLADGSDFRAALPLGPDALWALYEMLGLGAIRAEQWRISFDVGEAWADVEQDFDVRALLHSTRFELLRLRLAEGTPLAELFAALAPAPEVEGALLTLGVDRARFPRACANWLRPLAEVAKGEGAPCDRYLDSFAELVSAWSGRLALFIEEDGAPFLLVDVESGRGDDPGALATWLEPLIDAAGIRGVSGGVHLEQRSGRRHVLVDTAGEIVLTMGRDEELAWFARGDVATLPADLAVRFRQPASTAFVGAAPALMIRAGETGLDLHVVGDEVRVSCRPATDERSPLR